MHRFFRRTALTTTAGAVAAAVPAVASAKPARPQTGPNDLLLAQLADQALQAEAESVNAPSEAEQDAAHDRHAAIVERMLETPADSSHGVAAKVRAVRNSRPPHEPEQLCERLEHRALVELERVAGEGA